MRLWMLACARRLYALSMAMARYSLRRVCRRKLMRLSLGRRGFGAEIAAAGLEAGTLTQWLSYGLRGAGFLYQGAVRERVSQPINFQ